MYFEGWILLWQVKLDNVQEGTDLSSSHWIDPLDKALDSRSERFILPNTLAPSLPFMLFIIHMKEIESKLTSCIVDTGIGDRSLRLLRLKEMLTGLPRVNFEVLKFIFQHFVRLEHLCKSSSLKACT